MITTEQVQHLRKRWKEMEPVLNEQSRRRWAATEAKALGRGGVSCVVRVTGLARRTVYRGLDDICRRHKTEPGRIRKRGGGRKPKIALDPTLLRDIKTLVEPATRGDPMKSLLWTSRSRRKLTVSGVVRPPHFPLAPADRRTAATRRFGSSGGGRGSWRAPPAHRLLAARPS